ncbi:MAG: 30S ribosome-binding factor RbfA [bacterium]
MTRHLPYDRSERVADGIYQLVAESVVNDISDPRLLGVSVTRVHVTKDLRIARIYYHSIHSSAETKERAAGGFKSAAGFLRRLIAQSLSLKFTPELEFFYDESIDISERVDELIAGIKGESKHE